MCLVFVTFSQNVFARDHLHSKWPPDQPCDKIEKSHIFYDGIDVSQHADIKIYEK